MVKEVGRPQTVLVNGCAVATEFLGAQSCCLECPFPTCEESTKRYLRRKWRNADILRRLKLGYSVKAIALQLNVSIRTIQRAMKGVD